MIDNRFGDTEGAGRVGQKTVHNTLQSRQLGGELCCSLCISIQPFLYKFDLVAKMEGGGTEGGRVEGSFFKTDRAGIEQTLA
jgi:hypothetical protein